MRDLTLPLHPEITEIEKMAALQRALDSKAMARCSRNAQLLRYLIERECAGKSHEIKAFTIAVDVYGFGADFDAGENSIVRAQMNSLRKRLLRYYQDEGVNDALVISIPIGRYIPAFKRQACCTPDILKVGLRARAIAFFFATYLSADRIPHCAITAANRLNS